MKLNKQQQNIIMVVIVVIAMAFFAALVRKNINGNKVVANVLLKNVQIKENGENINNTNKENQKLEKAPLIVRGKKNSSLWTTYKDSDLGFEIDYPETATLEKKYGDNQFVSIKLLIEDDKDVLFNSYEIIYLDYDVSILPFTTDLSLIEWYKSYEPRSDEEQRQAAINFDGLDRNFSQDDLIIKTEYIDNYIKHFWKAKKLIHEGVPTTQISYYFKNNSTVYRISGTTLTENIDKNLPLLEKIINSFKFTD